MEASEVQTHSKKKLVSLIFFISIEPSRGENQTKSRRLQEKMRRSVENIEQRMREIRLSNKNSPKSSKSVNKTVHVNKNVTVNRNVAVNRNVSITKTIPQPEKISLKNLKIAGVDKKMISRILDEILEPAGKLTLDSVIGHSQAKSAIREMLLLPALRPDLFTGLRAPPKVFY